MIDIGKDLGAVENGPIVRLNKTSDAAVVGGLLMSLQGR